MSLASLPTFLRPVVFCHWVFVCLFVCYVHWCFVCVKVSDSPELDLQTVVSLHVCVLGIEPRSSGRAASMLTP